MCFDMLMMAVFLKRYLKGLRLLFYNLVERRVGLHEHQESAGVTEAVWETLEAIPGLEFVDLEQPRAEYMFNSLSGLP